VRQPRATPGSRSAAPTTTASCGRSSRSSTRSSFRRCGTRTFRRPRSTRSPPACR
jgi:hypothetical protein